MRRLLVVLVLLVLHPLPAHGQARGRGVVTGVITSEAGQPLPAASVSVRRASDSTLVGGQLTGRDGRFRVDGLAPGSYLVQVALLGHAPERREGVTITAEASTVSLGEIRLSAAAIQVEGVVARAERPAMTILPDRTVYSVREMPIAQGGTATDALRTVPELEVDPNGKVTARGATPRVHINGRPAPMRGEALDNYLQNLPAERIERIEVIPNPGARYDAEGQGGILNIVMRENTSLGLSGSATVNGGTGNQRGGSGRLNYQEGRFTFFGGGGFSLSDRIGTTVDTRENRIANPLTIIEQDGRSRNQSMFGNGDLTVEFKASGRGTLWAEARGHGSGSDGLNATYYTHLDAARTPTEHYLRDADNEFWFSSASASLGFRHVIEQSRHEYSAELRRSSNGRSYESLVERYLLGLDGTFLGGLTELTTVDGSEDQTDWSLQTDLTFPWTKNGKLDVGVRSTRRDTDSHQLLERLPAGGILIATPSGFIHQERFNSAYVTADRKFGRLGLQAGLRAERAETSFELPTEGEIFDNDYGSLFPSANVSYDLQKGRMMRVSYSKRLDRPWPWFLNPINSSTDPLNRFIGNPYLKPQYTHSFNFETSWSGQKGTLRFAPYYRRTVDSWEQFKEVDSAGVSTVTWENLAMIQTYGTSLSANLRQVGRLGGFVSLNGYRQVRDAGNLSQSFSGASWLWSTNTNLTLRVTQALNGQVSVNYFPARDIPQGRVSPMVWSSFGLRQQVMNRKGSVNLSVMDPFGLSRYQFVTEDPTHWQSGRSTWGMRRATLSFTYNFGRPPQSTRRRTQQDEAQPPADQPGGIR